MTAADPAISGTMNPPLGSGSTVSMPDGKGGSISLDKEGHAEYLKHWKNVAETAGSPYDHRIFSELLTEENLKKNESWLRASKVIYDMEHGAGAWDERVVVKGWSPEKAKEELGKYGINYGAELFFQDTKTLSEYLKRDGRSKEQQVALRYLKDAYDHKDWTAGSFWRGAWKSFSDPINLALFGGGLILAPVTGAGLVIGGGALLAKEGGKTLLKTAMTKIGRDTVVKEAAQEVTEKAAKEATEKLTTKIAKDFAAKPAAHTAGRTFTGAAVNTGAVSGASGLATEDVFQKIEIDGAAAYGEHKEYSYGRTAGAGLFSAGTGALFGAAMTVPLRPNIEALSDLVFDPIRNMKFLKPLAKEKNAENALDSAIKAEGQLAYDQKYENVFASTGKKSGSKKAAEQARAEAIEKARIDEAAKSDAFEKYLKELSDTQKAAIKEAGQTEYDKALAYLSREYKNESLAKAKAEIARKTAETKARYNGFQDASAAIEKAGNKAYDDTYKKVLNESKETYEQLKKGNGGKSVYDQEPNFTWAAEKAAKKAQQEAKDKQEAELEKELLGAYYQTIKKQELQQLEQETLQIAKNSPAAQTFSSVKAIIGLKQTTLPPLEMTTRTRQFVDHVTHSYYKHISAIFGKGKGEGSFLIKEMKKSADDLGKLGAGVSNGIISRAQAEAGVLKAKQDHAKQTEAIQNHLGDLRSNLDEIEKRLKNTRTRDDFVKKLDEEGPRWMPLPSLTVNVAKIRPYQIPKYMPYWPGESIRDKERKALVEFKDFLSGQVAEIEKIAADHKKWTEDAFKAVDSAITNKASDEDLGKSIHGAQKAVTDQVGSLTRRVGKDGDPLTYSMSENAVESQVTLKDRMFLMVESANADYNEWLLRSVREVYTNPFKRLVSVERPDDVYQNIEKIAWQIEKFWRNRDSIQQNDISAMASHVYYFYTVGMEQEALYAIRHLGYAFGRSEKQHGVKDLKQENYIPNFLKELSNLHEMALNKAGHTLDEDKHFSYFLARGSKTRDRVIGGHHPGPLIQGGQRAIENLYNDLTFWPRYSFRNRGTGLMAVPGSEHYVMEPLRGAWGRQIGFLTDTSKMDVLKYHLGKPLDKAKTQANKDADGALYKNVLQDEWGSLWKVPLRIVTRPIIDLGTPIWALEKITSMGAISKPGIYFASTAGGLWAFENTLEHWLDTDLPDTGASMLGAQLAVIDNTAFKLVRGAMWATDGLFGADKYAHHFDLEKNGLREFVETKIGDVEPKTLSPEENARKLIHRLTYDTAAGKPDTAHPLFMGRTSPGYLSAVTAIAGKLEDGTLVKEGQTESEAVAEIIRNTKTHEAGEAEKRAAAVIHSLSATGLLKKETDPKHPLYLAPGTNEHAEAVKQILEKNRILTAKEAEDIVRKIKGTQIQGQTSDPNLKNASHQQDPGASTTQHQKAAADPGASTTQHQKAAADPGTSAAPISTRSLGESWDSLASLPGRGLKAAYTFDGEMPREIEDVLNVGGSFLSGAFSLAGGLLSDLYNEKIEGGRWWLGAGAGVIGATIAGQLAKQIPIIKHIPFIGIIGAIFAFPLVMRFTKGLLDGTITRQGGDKSYAPIVTSSVSSANPAGVFPGPAPAVSSVSHTGGAPVEKVLWEDKDNKHAIINKITAKDPDGAGPKKFSVQVHNDDGSTHASLDVLKDWQGQGQAPVFISRESLTAMGLSKESFEYEAISHKDVNTQEDTPFISLRFMDNAKQTLQSVFIGAPNDFVPQP